MNSQKKPHTLWGIFCDLFGEKIHRDWECTVHELMNANTPVSQMWLFLAASYVLKYNRLPDVLYVFEHKTQYP